MIRLPKACGVPLGSAGGMRRCCRDSSMGIRGRSFSVLHQGRIFRRRGWYSGDEVDPIRLPPLRRSNTVTSRVWIKNAGGKNKRSPLTFYPIEIVEVGQLSNTILKCHNVPCVCHKTLRCPRGIHKLYLSIHTNEGRALRPRKDYGVQWVCVCETMVLQDLPGAVVAPVVGGKICK